MRRLEIRPVPSNTGWAGFGEVSYVLTDAAPPPALEAAAHRDDCEFCRRDLVYPYKFAHKN